MLDSPALTREEFQSVRSLTSELGLRKRLTLAGKSLLDSAMNTKTIALILGVMFAAGSLFAESPLMGDWKLDEAQSKLVPGMGKNTHVDYHDLMGGRVKVEVNGVDANGKKTDIEWKGRFDGHDYPVKGDPTIDMRSYTMIDERTLAMVSKKGGAVVNTGKIQVSADGKSRVVTVNGRNAAGKKYKSVAVYHRD